MAARADVNVVTQIGVETTLGTAVAASKRFPDLDVELSPETDVKLYRPSGSKANEVAVPHKKWAVGSYKGPLTYGSLSYYLSSMKYAAPVQIGATTGYTWTHDVAATAENAFKSYTMERGDANDAGKVAGAFFNSWNFNISRDEATVSGEVIARSMSFGNTLTATPTTIENVPVALGDMNVFLDSSLSDITGGTGDKLTDVFNVSISIPKFRDLKWVINSANTSWLDTVEQAVMPKLSIETEWSSQMRTIYAAMIADSSPTYYVNVKSVGDNIGASADYTFSFIAALKLTEAKEQRRGNGDVFGYKLDFEIVNSPADSLWFRFVNVNKVSAL
jgi:hypothetical protein